MIDLDVRINLATDGTKTSILCTDSVYIGTTNHPSNTPPTSPIIVIVTGIHLSIIIGQLHTGNNKVILLI